MKTLISVQYLRGIAALAVVIYHVLQWRHGGFEVGRAGVDVFFVISGLIMWRVTASTPSPLAGEGGLQGRMRGRWDSPKGLPATITERRATPHPSASPLPSPAGGEGSGVTPAAFLWRRFTRVAPAYWLATLTVAGIVVVWPTFLIHVRPTWTHLALSLAFVPHNDPEGLPFPLLAPGWTLTYEAAFYLVFAAGLAMRQGARLWWVTLALTTIAAAGFVCHPAYTLGANPMMLQFATGVWLGKLSGAGALPGRAWGAILLFGGVAIFAGLAVSGYVNELWRPLIWGVPSAMIVAGAVSLEAGGAMVSVAPLKTLGDASYSLYLWHVPVVAIVAHGMAEGRSPLFIPAAMIAAIVAGVAGRVLVEKPALALLRNTDKRRRPNHRRGGGLTGAGW